MGTIQIRKVARKVTIGKQGEQRQKVEKTYGKIEQDKFFKNMPDDVKVLHEKRSKVFTLLMCINDVIEDKLFKIYE